MKITGKGISDDLLEKDESGVKRIFLENISTKEENRHCGYGCYLAFEISKRCGWEINADNSEKEGSRFTLDNPALSLQRIFPELFI